MTLKTCHVLTLPTKIGYGTGTAWYKGPNWEDTDRKLIDAIKTAISLGYYHLDGAEGMHSCTNGKQT